MGAAYQLIGSRFSADSKFGMSPFGTCPFGGDEYVPDPVPALAPGSDDLTESNNWVAAEVVHERDGVIVGSRLHSLRRRWHVVHRALSRAEANTLLKYFKVRRFNLLPTGDGDDESIIVKWVQREFGSKTLRGGYLDIEYDLEELP